MCDGPAKKTGVYRDNPSNSWICGQHLLHNTTHKSVGANLLDGPFDKDNNNTEHKSFLGITVVVLPHRQ